MKLKKIIKKLKSGKLNVDEALQKLTEIGYCPSLLNDDNGRWVCKFDGIQTVSYDGRPHDFTASYYVKAHELDTDIRRALIKALEE